MPAHPCHALPCITCMFLYTATEPIEKQVICSQQLNSAKAKVFQQAVQRQYWYELFLDDLPVWGFVGEAKHGKEGNADEAFIFTHKTFDIAYNGNRVRHAYRTHMDGCMGTCMGTWATRGMPMRSLFFARNTLDIVCKGITCLFMRVL